MFSHWLKNEVIYLVASDSAIVLQTQLLMSTTHASMLLFLYNELWRKNMEKEVWHNLDEKVTH